MLPYVLSSPECKHPVLEPNNAVNLFTYEDVTVMPGERVHLDLGVRFELPPNICGLLCLHPTMAKLYKLQIGNTMLGKMLNTN
jgi:dUTPase